ncbi:AAA family ATPase [Xanthomonas sp. WHRI 7945]|nr:AAA family ATPase [Xanthomonas campestris pv. campestris]
MTARLGRTVTNGTQTPNHSYRGRSGNYNLAPRSIIAPITASKSTTKSQTQLQAGASPTFGRSPEVVDLGFGQAEQNGMANFRFVKIENFKGITELTLKFNTGHSAPVHTLIGLNESGKTTILEALSHFVTGDNAVSSLFDGIHSKSAIDTLIPVSKKAAFTGHIRISAMVSISESDFERANALAEKHGLEIDKARLMKDFIVERRYSFEDSIPTGTMNYFNFTLYIRKKSKSRSTTSFKYHSKFKDEGSRLWHSVANSIGEGLPRIAYFPTFLVDMPKKIYLAEHPSETAVNRYYRLVIQDILDSIDEGLDLGKHVVERINKFKESDTSGNWFSSLFGGTQKSPIDSVFTKISSKVTKEVLGSWQRVFHRKISAKNILVEWHIDAEKDDLPYATFSIFDGESRYYISERSLGFRWFFSFLIFTAFKHKAKSSTLFVFDEPAANLHAKAQTELLKSFSRTVADGDGIVYSTHSHHMINPNWVTGAYIIENTALDYDSDDDTFGLNVKPTNIIATPYRNFVAQHPNRTSYFQPVIDMLEYVTPAVIGDPPYVLVEGITDFYGLKIANRNIKKKHKFSIMPGVGAGASGPQIGILLGRGDHFLVLLDDDAAGRRAKEQYQTNWYLNDDQIFTLADIDTKLSGKRLEDLICIDTIEKIKIHAGLTSKPNKKQIGLYLAEKFSSESHNDAFGEETQKNLEGILGMLQQRLA